MPYPKAPILPVRRGLLNPGRGLGEASYSYNRGLLRPGRGLGTPAAIFNRGLLRPGRGLGQDPFTDPFSSDITDYAAPYDIPTGIADNPPDTFPVPDPFSDVPSFWPNGSEPTLIPGLSPGTSVLLPSSATTGVWSPGAPVTQGGGWLSDLLGVATTVLKAVTAPKAATPVRAPVRAAAPSGTIGGLSPWMLAAGAVGLALVLRKPRSRRGARRRR